ncbi:MAG: efflux RND transporter periplasmic adaptor subunit [Deltaproteobacteria bacterium]|jgi:membrane fusion protein (multidrug efflux system)|nr:efflux RND transporter periplasmic adaptor subunit [Deltaproteobacteria bacterium]
MLPSSLIKKWIFVLIPLIIVALAAAVIGYGILRSVPQTPPPPQKVVLAEISSQAPISSLRAVALISAEQSVDLKPRVSGYLIGKYIQEGQKVKAGDLLFLIEQGQYEAAQSSAQADLDSAQAQLDLAEIEFERAKDLYLKRSMPKSDYDKAVASRDQAQAAVKSASARLDQAKLNYGYTFIRAPFDGLASDTPFSVGSFISPEVGVLATIVSVDPVEAIFGLSDTLMAQVRSGQERSGLPGGSLENVKPRLLLGQDVYYEFDGEFSYVAPEVDRNTDTIKFKAKFANPKNVLAPGQSVIVSLEPVEPQTVLILPKEALMTSEGESFVYQAGPDPRGGGGLVAVQTPVKTGVEFAEGFEILSGLAEGDKVMVMGLMSGGSRLRPGSPVEIIGEADAKPSANQAAGQADGGPGASEAVEPTASAAAAQVESAGDEAGQAEEK